jgi:protein-L-isoaspartate(D-aspartate) O-methyltransferase
MTIDYSHARELMVEQQIRPWDVLEIRVLDVLARLPREAFVSESHRDLA